MTLIQIVLLLVLLLVLVATWRRMRQRVISLKEALAWSTLWIGAGIVVLLPQTTTTVANLFGVGRGADLILYASVIALFFLVFKSFVAIDGLERKLTDIVRKDALKDLPERDRS